MGTTIRHLHESAEEIVRWLKWERQSLELFHEYGQQYLSAGGNVYLGVLEDALKYRGIDGLRKFKAKAKTARPKV